MAGSNVIRELVIEVKVDADTSGFAKMDSAQADTTTNSVALGTVIGNLTTALIENGLAAAKAAFAYANDLVFGTSAAADAVAKTAAQLDITTKGLQRVRGAATLTGADTATMDKAVRKLTKGLADAVEGTGPAADALEVLGLKVEDIDSFLAEGDIEGALGEIGDKFNATGESAQKSAALMDLFGAAGTKLRPLVEQGSKGIKALGDEIAATGSIIDDEALAQFEELEDAQFLLDQTSQGLKNTIATALAPAITDIAGEVQQWVTENDDFISQDLPVIIADVADSVVVLVKDTLELVGIWREFIRDASDLAEVLTEDVDPALGSVGEGMSALGNFADGVKLALLDMLEGFLETIGAGEALIAIIKEIRKEALGDNGPKGQRGAPGFAGGGSALVNPTVAQQADASGDTTKLRKVAADPRFNDTDRAKAAAQADIIDTRETAKAQAKASAARETRQSAIDQSRARGRSARKQSRKGGGGGGARATAPAADEPSVDDLIGAAIGAATGESVDQVRTSNALAGTMVVNVNQSQTFNAGDVTIDFEVPASIIESGDVGALVDALKGEFVSVQSMKDANDFFGARVNVGAG